MGFLLKGHISDLLGRDIMHLNESVGIAETSVGGRERARRVGGNKSVLEGQEWKLRSR